MAESSGDVVICSERAWRAGVIAVLVTAPMCVLAAIVVAVRYGPMTLGASALVIPNVLLLVAVVVERSVAALERRTEDRLALRPRIAGPH